MKKVRELAICRGRGEHISGRRRASAKVLGQKHVRKVSGMVRRPVLRGAQ